MIVGKSTVQKKNTLTLISIALMFSSIVFFFASQVAQLAMKAELLSLLTLTVGLSAVSIIVGLIVAYLSKKTMDKNFLFVYDSLWQRGPEVRSKIADSNFISDSIYREE